MSRPWTVKNATTLYYFAPTVETDEEGVKTATFSEGVAFMGYSYPAGDKGLLHGEIGHYDQHDRKLLTTSDIEFEKGGGVGVFSTDSPDYLVSEIEAYTQHKELTLEERG